MTARGRRWGRILGDAVRAGVAAAGSAARRRPPESAASSGAPVIEYAPADDGDADPGEVVWTWVPFEDDPRRGKDRPVLVVGRDGDRLVALMLSSRDHDLDAEDEARFGRVWMDIGSGAWDARRRASEVRLDRVLRITPDSVRREGSRLDPETFAAVAAALRAHHGW